MERRVLLVGGDGRRRAAVRDALSACGMTVLEASSTTEAMGLLRDARLHGLVVRDESRQLALRGLCGMVKKVNADARFFVLLHESSNEERVLGAVGEDGVLIPNGCTIEQIASTVMESLGSSTPLLWKFAKSRVIRKDKLWETSVARAAGSKEDLLVAQLAEQFAQDDTLRGEFIEAAKTAERVLHPNIPPIVEVGGRDDLPFVVSDVGQGLTLNETRRSNALSKHWLGPEIAIWIAAEILGALDATHRTQAVHGAFSPDCVWLGSDGRARLLHLGVGNLCCTLERGLRASMSFEVPQPYLAPEQIRDKPADPRTDVYAVGVMLHEMLSRRPLFLRSRAAATQEAILTSEVPDLGSDEIPRGLAEIVKACLERSPTQRPESAATVRAQILQATKTIDPDRAARPALAEFVARAIGA